MVNPLAGEVSLVLNGAPHVCKLTLGALAELETHLETSSLVGLVERFEAGSYTARDVIAVLIAGLRGGGWTGSADSFLTAEIEGGPVGAAKTAATLLARAFAPPS